MASDPTQLPGGVPEDALDALYGLPLAEFTPARDALAKELRGTGAREAADWVKALKKPSSAAWVLNQLARTQADAAKSVLEAGDAVRAAQARVLSGTGERGELAGATNEHAAAMQALLSRAPGLLDSDGHSPSSTTLERAADTLRAIALDDEARAGFASGRLTREHQAAGLGFALGGGPSPAKTAKKAKEEKKDEPAPKPPAPRRGDSKKRKERAQAALKQARARHREQAKQVAERQRELSATEREAESVQRKLAKATTALEKSHEKQAEAQAALAAAEEAARRA